MLRLSAYSRMKISGLAEYMALRFSRRSLITTGSFRRIIVCPPNFSDTIGPSMRIRPHKSIDSLFSRRLTLLRPLSKLMMEILHRHLQHVSEDWQRRWTCWHCLACIQMASIESNQEDSRSVACHSATLSKPQLRPSSPKLRPRRL